MPNTIEEYLVQLRRGLEGSDPAIIRDALADAEEHLRTAYESVRRDRPELPEKDALASVLSQYGAPAEIASAYQEIESLVVPPLAPPDTANGRSFVSRFFGVIIEPRAWAALFYMIFALVTGIIYFTWAVTGLSLSAGFIVLIIGLPFFALFLLSIQGIALVEGRLVEALLGVRMPRRPVFSRKDLSVWERFKSLVSDKRSWATMVYMVLQLPLGILYFTISITFLSLGVGLFSAPFVVTILDLPIVMTGNADYYLPDWTAPFVAIFGILVFILTLHLAKLIGRIHGRLAKALLVKE